MAYTNAFFRPADLKYVADQYKAMVRRHLLGLVPSSHTVQTLKYVEGIAEHLDVADVPAWIDPFIRSLISRAVSDPVKSAIRKHLLNATLRTSADVDRRIDRRLERWIKCPI